MSPVNDENSWHYRPRVEFARTPDDWDLALHRYPSPRKDLPPVIVCPGYACNRHFVDFDDRYSLARFMSRRGFDTWVLELRGRGYSEPVFGSKGRGWTFDDFVRYDVPTAVAYVRGRCEDRRPVWIGHSMGGMVIYAALGQEAETAASTAGAVTMASPVVFPAIGSPGMLKVGRALAGLPLPQRLPQRTVFVGLWSIIGGLARAGQAGMNRTNVDRKAFDRALPKFICNASRNKLRQFIEWTASGTFCSADRATDYRAGLRQIRTPALVIAGAGDQVAPPEAVRPAAEEIAAPTRTYREFGVRQGDSANYGHVDLIFGRRAPEEVFPMISRWIEEVLVDGRI